MGRLQPTRGKEIMDRNPYGPPLEPIKRVPRKKQPDEWGWPAIMLIIVVIVLTVLILLALFVPPINAVG